MFKGKTTGDFRQNFKISKFQKFINGLFLAFSKAIFWTLFKYFFWKPKQTNRLKKNRKIVFIGIEKSPFWN